MKKQKKFRNPPHSPLPKRNRGGTTAGQQASVGGRILLLTFLFCLLGSAWVWKENLNDRMATRMLSIEKQNRELWIKSGTLRAELSELTKFTRIEEAARIHLGMIPPQVPPDTVWYSGTQERAVIGASMFYDFRERGKR